MMLVNLLTSDDLPEGFEYPSSFRRLVEGSPSDLEPWVLLEAERVRERFGGLTSRYPSRRLLPFAMRVDTDDVACWDLDRGDIVMIHDYASPGWELNGRYADIAGWLARVAEDASDLQDRSRSSSGADGEAATKDAT